MQASLRVGLVGAGLSATTFHAPLLRADPRFQISSILRSSSAAPVVGLEAVQVHTDLQRFLAAPLDLVLITTPTHTHAAIARAALEAGKHVVVEKPFTATAAEADALVQLAREHKRLLAVYHNRRWDGDFLTLQRLVASGCLGRVVELEAHFDRFRYAVKAGWKEEDLPGGGILYDLGSHLVHQALVLFGLPAHLTCHSANQRRLPGAVLDDAFTLTLHYPAADSTAAGAGAAGAAGAGPLTVILRASMLARIPGPRFAAHGTAGSFVVQGLDVQEAQLRAGLGPHDPGFGQQADPQAWGVLDTVAFDAAALSSGAGADGGLPCASVDEVAAAVAAAGQQGGGGGSGARLRVVTERGCWASFYDDVAAALLQSSGSGSDADPSSRLEVAPAVAADVVRLLELAVASAREGRTLRVGG